MKTRIERGGLLLNVDIDGLDLKPSAAGLERLVKGRPDAAARAGNDVTGALQMLGT